MKKPFVYILASKPYGTLYTGVTSNIQQRVWQHKEDVAEGFTQEYSIHDLVYFEPHETMEAAIVREKQIKDWKRKWKIRLINDKNPDWNDLSHLLNM